MKLTYRYISGLARIWKLLDFLQDHGWDMVNSKFKIQNSKFKIQSNDSVWGASHLCIFSFKALSLFGGALRALPDFLAVSSRPKRGTKRRFEGKHPIHIPIHAPILNFEF
jgi:hypothetical protein